jgi:hypothetical protein
MSFVREPQYTNYSASIMSETQSPLPFTQSPPAGWQPEANDNMKLIMSNLIRTNGDYRKYALTKADLIREKNTNEYAKTL